MICPRRNFDPRQDSGSSAARYHLKGSLWIPRRAVGMAILAWESGWNRGYRIRRALAGALKAARFGTCEVDLFGPLELDDPRKLDDIGLLSMRLQAAVDYLHNRAETAHLPLTLVAGDRAAPAAVMVAAQRPANLRALACCAGEVLRAPIDAAAITVPTILVAPSKDAELVESNEEFFWSLSCTSQLAVVRGASRQFHEPGTLLACEKVVTEWCQRHLEEQPAPAEGQWTAGEALFASRN